LWPLAKKVCDTQKVQRQNNNLNSNILSI